MNLEKVVFAFFIVLALTLNFGFFVGPMDNPGAHQPGELGAALAVSLIATIIKFGDRSQLGAVMLATSLVADLQLVAAALVWAYAAYATELGATSATLAKVVALSGGALLANLVSVTLLVGETLSIRR
jgi:Ca2+/H+ antiporter, TMEM165/GDT1 family